MINRVNLALACERVCLYYRIGMWNQTALVKCVMHLVCGCECWACPDYYTIYYDIQHTLQCILNSPAFGRQLFFQKYFSYSSETVPFGRTAVFQGIVFQPTLLPGLSVLLLTII